MSGKEKLEQFLLAIDEWIECKGLPKIEENESVSTVLNMRSDELRLLSPKECLFYAYELYAHAEYLESVRAKEKIVLEWSNSSLWYIISKSMESYGTNYTKWEQKYYSAIRENPLASEILKIKKHAESRVSIIDGKSNRVQKMADTLSNLSRIK